MLSLNEFILEQNVQGELKKLALAVSVDMPDNVYIFESKYNISKIFELYTKNEKVEASDIPVFNYSNEKIERIIKNGYDKNIVYNKIDAKQNVSSKSDWHKLHEDSDFTPIVAYTAHDIKNLKYPIVAKPDNRYAGQGIAVFGTYEDALSADLKDFAIFSEKIDIDKEFRIFCWNGKPLMQVNRIPANKETKTLSKPTDDKLKFNYELQSDSITEGLEKLIKEFSEAHSDLNFYSIDIALSKSGKPFVIEMSSEPGPIFGIMGHVYKEMYNDYYDTPLSEEAINKIDKYIKEDIQTTLDSDKERFTIK